MAEVVIAENKRVIASLGFSVLLLIISSLYYQNSRKRRQSSPMPELNGRVDPGHEGPTVEAARGETSTWRAAWSVYLTESTIERGDLRAPWPSQVRIANNALVIPTHQ